MSGRFTLVPASTMLTEAKGGRPRSGGIGFAIVGGQLNVAIAGDDGRVMVAALHASVLDEFCGTFADHLTAVSPVAADARQEAVTWPTWQ